VSEAVEHGIGGIGGQHQPGRGGPRTALLAAVVVLALVIVACGGSNPGPTATSTTIGASSTTSTVRTSTSTAATVAPAPGGRAAPAPHAEFAALQIDDRSRPDSQYRRDDWPHWADVDGNGCDARQDALIAWSVVPATVNRVGTCKVITGSWVSPYDGLTTSAPSSFDVDHLVPLENAFISGGWRWDVTRRRAFANDPSELVVASATSNRTKGSDPPNAWRPPNRDSWCAYATGWVDVKVTWGLTATTEERDALGQMLDTCGPAGPVWPGIGSAVAGGGSPSGSADAPSPAPAPAPGSGGGGVYYANCTAARAAGAAPLRAGQPGYRSALDGDKDGVACE
jgi:hypothetical protein